VLRPAAAGSGSSGSSSATGSTKSGSPARRGSSGKLPLLPAASPDASTQPAFW
jgi:hypothetical protein